MCGIAVIAARDSIEDVRGMLAQLRHRGPDDADLHVHHTSRVTIGHTRLAIVDPPGGHQPFVGADGAVAVSNGEIYNHRQLVDEHHAGRLGSGSDAAVLLPMFRDFGADLVDHLDGMYAVVIVSGDGTVIAARDRLGIKPLYRASRDGEFAFASEMKTLRSERWDGIETVLPGHVWVGNEAHQYYELPEPTLSGPDDETAVEHWCGRLREVLERAVVKRLMSDVPLGTFLSGGLDSSIVTALAARHQPELSTFALGFEGSGDLEAARRVADHLGTTHHEIKAADDEPHRVLPEVLYHLESWDRDLVRSALPTYLVAQFAASELKVVLTGEGADELFAGYAYHAGYADELDTLQRELRRSVAVMHDSNLQRVDRMTTAHSLEARVPFLFDEGSGTVDRLRALAESALDALPDEPGAGLRDVEEAWYFQQLRSDLPDWPTVQANTSVWANGRIPTAQRARLSSDAP